MKRRTLLAGMAASIAFPVVAANGAQPPTAPPAPPISADSLPDYEEGLWEPMVNNRPVGTGRYTKIGSAVFLTATLNLPPRTDAYVVTGLPFVPKRTGSWNEKRNGRKSFISGSFDA